MDSEDKSRLPEQVAGGLLGGFLGALLPEGPLGAVLASTATPAAMHLLTERATENLDRTLSFAARELERRYNLGDRPRPDLFQVPYRRAEDLITGTILKAQQEHESRKHKYLGHFLVHVLLDQDTNLDDAFDELNLAVRLTYQQYVLLQLFTIRTSNSVEGPHVGEDPLSEGAQTRERLATAHLLLDMFNTGLLRLASEKDTAATYTGIGGFPTGGFGGDANPIQRTIPTTIQVSSLGWELAKSLGLHEIPGEEVEAMAARLS